MNAVLNITRRLHCKWESGIGKQVVGARANYGNLAVDPPGEAISFAADLFQAAFQIFDQILGIFQADV
jgi:hypothetical protein